MKRSQSLIISGSVAALLLIIIVAIFVISQNGSNQESVEQDTQVIVQEQNQENTSEESKFINGTYSATGRYRNPTGEIDDLGVTITLEDDVITDYEIEVQAKNDISVGYQTRYKDDVEELIVGKQIDDLELGRVGSSSLTSIGFNEALESIRQSARN